MNNAYPLFNDIRNPKLRAWNRLNIIFNMKESIGSYAANGYTKQFKKDELLEILRMGVRVLREGYENVRRSIIRENNANA